MEKLYEDEEWLANWRAENVRCLIDPIPCRAPYPEARYRWDEFRRLVRTAISENVLFKIPLVSSGGSYKSYRRARK